MGLGVVRAIQIITSPACVPWAFSICGLPVSVTVSLVTPPCSRINVNRLVAGRVVGLALLSVKSITTFVSATMWFGRPPACGMSATSCSHVSFICGSSTRTCRDKFPDARSNQNPRCPNESTSARAAWARAGRVRLRVNHQAAQHGNYDKTITFHGLVFILARFQSRCRHYLRW
jgi:hypothetical protein